MVLNLGNIINVTECIRLKVFETGLMDLALEKNQIFENIIGVSEDVSWLICCTLNSYFIMNDALQFELFSMLVTIFLKHSSEENFSKCILAMRFLLKRESKLADRIQCIVKSNLVTVIIKHIQKNLSTTSESTDLVALAFDGLADFLCMAGSSYCTSEFVQVA